MAEDRTPHVDSVSGLVPCPPDEAALEHERRAHKEKRERAKSHAREERRRTQEARSLPLRPLN